MGRMFARLTCYLDSAAFEFDRVCSLIDVTDKFYLILKGEGITCKLCFDRKIGIVLTASDTRTFA